MAAIPKDDEEKKKRGNFGDAAAAAIDRSVNQIDTGPMVGRPGDFPVNPDGTPMMKPAAAGFQPGAVQPAAVQQPAMIGRTVQVTRDGSQVLTPDQQQANANQTAAYVAGAQANAAARPQDQPAIGIAPRSSGSAPGQEQDPQGGSQSEYGRQMRALGSFLVDAPVKAIKHIVSAPGYGFSSASDAPAEPKPMGGLQSNYVTRMKPEQYDARATSTSAPIQTNSAPDGTPKSPAQEPAQQQQAPVQAPAAGAVIEPPKTAAGFIPAQIRHSGNDWQARNDLRNLQVSASSITEKDDQNSPAMLAYKAALAADTALKEGKNPAVESQNRDAAFMDRTQAEQSSANYRAQVANSIAQQRVDNEGVKLGFEANAAKQIQALQKEIVNETDPKKLAVLQDKLQTITGKYQRPEPANRLTVVPGGSSVDEKTGQVVQRPSLVVDNQTGNVINVHGGERQQSPPSNHVDALRKDKSLAKQFDEIYGAGAAAKILGVK